MEMINGQDILNSNMIPVSGDEGVNAYPVARGNQMVLFNQYANEFWIKAVDLSGRTMLRKFKYEEEIIEQPLNADPRLSDMLDKISTKMDDISRRLDSIENRNGNNYKHKNKNNEDR